MEKECEKTEKYIRKDYEKVCYFIMQTMLRIYTQYV